MPSAPRGTSSSLDLALLSAGLLLALDQVTKMLALTFIAPITADTPLPETMLSLSRTWNPGSTLIPAPADPASQSAMTAIFIVVAFIASFALVVMARGRIGTIGALACGVAMASLLGNTFDRIFHGAVIDWIMVMITGDTGSTFAIFNIADVLGPASIVLFTIAVLRGWLHRRPPTDDGLIEVGPPALGVVYPYRRR